MRPKLLIYCSIASAGDKMLWGKGERSPLSHLLSYREVPSSYIFLMCLCFNSPLAFICTGQLSRQSAGLRHTHAVPGPISSPDLMSLQTGYQKADKFLPLHSVVALVLDIARLCPAQRPCFFFFLFFYELAAPLLPLDCS